MTFYIRSIIQSPLLVLSIALIFPLIACGQNCFNSNFETGNLSGYSSFVGKIADDGTITVDDQRYSEEQHKVFFILDGNDPIAEQYCTENKELPLVPPGGGAFALRLGNSQTGANAEKVTISFTVTPENSFFLLNYAVLLNDPNHEPYEQPRFRLSIKDSQGEEYPCGYYEVAAARNIENFENCDGNWKVRPWTTIGIELQSYLGDRINIEMRTNDCSRGGHAGYAYLDANCKPLQIELFDNCDENSLARMRVTSGFDSYLWNTGDTSDEIFIQDPVVGDTYYVTVTSATGCDLVLSDTIPAYTPEDPPIFDPSITRVFCSDTAFWFSPSGTNLHKVYSVELGQFIDSMVVNNILRSGYTFIAYSNSGCPLDTVTHYFKGLPYISESIVNPKCYNDPSGSIFLSPLIEEDIYSYKWDNGEETSYLENISEGCYSVTVSNGDCTIEREFELFDPDPLIINVVQDNFICRGETGSARFDFRGGLWPVEFSFDEGQTFNRSRSYSDFPLGKSIVIAQDAEGCRDTVVVNFNLYNEEEIEVIQTVIRDTCAASLGGLTIEDILNGRPPFLYSLDGFQYQTNGNFNNLPYGDYTLYIEDGNGCKWERPFNIDTVFTLNINAYSYNTTCEEDNGIIQVFPSSNFNNTYYLNEQHVGRDSIIDGLGANIYGLRVENMFGCSDSLIIDIEDSSLPQSVALIIDNQCDYSEDGSIQISDPSNNALNREYNWSNGDTTQNLFDLKNGIYEVTITDEIACTNSFTYQVTSPDPIEAEISGQFYNCPGLNNGVINILPSGGYGRYEYSINGGVDFVIDSTFTDLSSNDYNIIVKDQNLCIKDTTISIKDYLPYESIIIQTAGDTCTNSLGMVLIENIESGTPPFLFSLDGLNFQQSNIFENLQYGFYSLNILDGNGCIWTEELYIDSLFTLNINTIVEDATCNENNGRIIVTPSSDYNNQYFINNNYDGQNPEIESLPSGIYNLLVRNEYGCEDDMKLEIQQRRPIIDDVEITYSPCLENTNQIRINVSNGYPPYRYAIDNQSYQSQAVYNSLDSGYHSISVIDSISCIAETNIYIKSVVPITVEQVIYEHPDCDQENGEIQIIANGGAGDLTVFSNSEVYDLSHIYQNLSVGDYSFLVRDTTDCSAEVDLKLYWTCNYYVPNIFSPNDDNIDDVFQVFFSVGAEPTIEFFHIYDRWGGLIHSVTNLNVVDEPLLWDGTSNGNEIETGVYTYVMSGRFKNGELIQDKGTITIVR